LAEQFSPWIQINVSDLKQVCALTKQSKIGRRAVTYYCRASEPSTAAIGMDIFLRAAKPVQPADVRRVARCTRSGGNEQVAAGDVMATVA
jgi:hypothetical protein